MYGIIGEGISVHFNFPPLLHENLLLLIRSSADKGYIGPADFLTVGSPEVDQKESPNPSRIRRRISTASAGSDTSLNRPSSPIFTKKRQNAWGAPNRYSNSDDTASVSSRSLPGSPSGSPNLGRKETSQRLSLSNTDMDVREEFKSEFLALVLFILV